MSSIKSNFVYNLLLTVSNILFPIITFPYASRILGPIGIGKVQFVTNFAMYFVLMAALGIPLYGIREVAKHKADLPALKNLFTELVLLNVITTILLLALYTFMVAGMPSLRTDFNFYAVAALMLIFGPCNVDWLFSGLERYKFIAIRSLIVKAIGFLTLFVIIRDRHDDIYYLAITVGGIVLNNLLNIWSARKYFSRAGIDLLRLRRHFRPLLYIFSTVAAISIYTMMDTIILGFLTDFKAVGYYTAASRINKITIPVLTSFGMVLIPQISVAFKERNTNQINFLVRNSLDFVTVIGIPMTMGLITLAPELIALFSGREFADAVLPMQILAPVVLIIGISSVWSVLVLTPSGNERAVTISSVFGLVASLILNFSLIPHFTYIGATLANLLSETAVMFGLLYFSRKVVHVAMDLRLTVGTLLISLGFYPVILGLRYLLGSNHILVCITSVVVCGFLFGVFQFLVVRNLAFIKMITQLWNGLVNRT